MYTVEQDHALPYQGESLSPMIIGIQEDLMAPYSALLKQATRRTAV